MLRKNDQQALWWLLEQQLWGCQDMVRFANYTEVLSDLDRTLLLKALHTCETIVKKGRQDNAIPPAEISGNLLPTSRPAPDDVDPE